jgi:tellurium resistance protein TerD
MSTWWIPATRADLGLRAGDLGGASLTVTNRGWRVLHQILTTVGARHTERLADPDAYLPGSLAANWGGHLLTADGTDWLQIGRWDGRAVIAAGIVHTRQSAQYADLYELTPLQDTPIAPWLTAIGQHLTTTPTGLHLTGRPRKENPMTVNLSKGGKVDLTKEAGGTLTKVRVGLGWDARKTAGADYDLDASAVGLGDNGLCVTTDWFVYYNNLTSPGGAIVHQGDNLTGTGTGDDEQIVVDLAGLPAEVTDVRFVVTIHEAKTRGQSFGNVENAFIRVVDDTTGTELARYDLTEDTEPGVNALVFAKLYRHGGAWNFRAIGDGFTDELQGLVNAYKIGA